MSMIDRFQQTIQKFRAGEGETAAPISAKKTEVEGRTSSAWQSRLTNFVDSAKTKITLILQRSSTESNKTKRSIDKLNQTTLAPQTKKTEFKPLQQGDVFARELSRKMTQFFNTKSDPKTIHEISDAVNSELAKIYKEYPNWDGKHVFEKGEKPKYILPEVKEQLAVLHALQKQIEFHPELLLGVMKECQGDPLYKSMGSVKFLSLASKIEHNIEEMEKNDKFLSEHEKKLSTLQKVAIFTYTTGEYKRINPALRAAKGENIKDTGIQSHAEHLQAGLDLLAPFEQFSEDFVLRRGMNLPDEVVEALFGGKTMTDAAFVSTSSNPRVDGAVVITISPPVGSKQFSAGKEIPAFLTAWGAEKEILFGKSTVFEVESKKKNSDGTWNIKLRSQ